MQMQFRNELHAVTAQIKARRGVPLSNPNRAINIARSGRSVAKLHLSDQIQANKRVKFTRHAKFLGNGLAVIDFGSRIGNVRYSYRAGGHWERGLFIESSSFALSTAVGTTVIKSGLAALSFLIVATPLGWIGLIIGGLAVAGTAAGLAMTTNWFIKKHAGSSYDYIMDTLR